MVVASSLGRSGVVLVALVALAQCLPLWQHYWFDTHEHSAYVLRVVEFEAALRQGDLYPRWAADFYGGYGSPFFVFYAPLVFAGSAVASALLGSAVLGLKLWITLASIAAGVGVYVAVETETRRSDAALLAALVYLAAAYRLADVYVRGDIAEYTALACLPWAIGGYRRLAHSLSRDDGALAALQAAAAHAALLFSHAIMGLWGTLLLAVVCLATTWQLLKRRTLRRVALLWTGFALALAVSSVYIGSALVQKRYVNIAVAAANYYDPANQLMPLKRLLERGQFGLLPLVAVAVVLSLIAVALRSSSKAALGWSLGALFCAFLSTRYAEAFWLLRLPLTRFVQFPWRLHGLAALAASLAIGLAWSTVLLKGSWREPVALLLGAAALLVTAPLCSVPTPLARGSFPETSAEIRSGMHSTTEDEYLPRWVPAAPAGPAKSLLSKASAIELVSSFSRGSVNEVELLAHAAGQAELRLHMFPGWRVETLEGPATVGLATSKAGLVALELPRAGHYRLRLSFGSSPVRAVFGGLALLAAIAAWPLLRFLARKRSALSLVGPALAEPAERLAA